MDQSYYGDNLSDFWPEDIDDDNWLGEGAWPEDIVSEDEVDVEDVLPEGSNENLPDNDEVDNESDTEEE